jgi:hypothetical protein
MYVCVLCVRKHFFFGGAHTLICAQVGRSTSINACLGAKMWGLTKSIFSSARKIDIYWIPTESCESCQKAVN